LLTTKSVSSIVSKEHERAHYVWVTYPLDKSLLSCPKTPNFDHVQSTEYFYKVNKCIPYVLLHVILPYVLFEKWGVYSLLNN
jgi:hypothetical protein